MSPGQHAQFHLTISPIISHLLFSQHSMQMWKFSLKKMYFSILFIPQCVKLWGSPTLVDMKISVHHYVIPLGHTACITPANALRCWLMLCIMIHNVPLGSLIRTKSYGVSSSMQVLYSTSSEICMWFGSQFVIFCWGLLPGAVHPYSSRYIS